MRRMRSLRLLQKPPKCVAQLSRAVCVVPSAVREDDALGLPGQHRLVQPVKVEADDVAARERSREQAGPLSVARLPRKVTPHRSPSYTPSPWPLGIAASADSKSCSSNVRPIAWGK